MTPVFAGSNPAGPVFTMVVFCVKEHNVLDIYESSEAANESVRESILVAFRKYIFHYIKMARAKLFKRTIFFDGSFGRRCGGIFIIRFISGYGRSVVE